MQNMLERMALAERPRPTPARYLRAAPDAKVMAPRGVACTARATRADGSDGRLPCLHGGFSVSR